MKKYKISIYLSTILQVYPLYSRAQVSVYETAFNLGFLHNMAQRGPKHKTNVSDVKFVKPITKTFGFTFRMLPKTKIFYGVEFMYDEFDHGYLGKPNSYDLVGNIGITSGELGVGDRVVLYKAGLTVGYKLCNYNKWEIRGMFTPSIAYYNEAKILNDTLSNSFWRSPHYGVVYFRERPPEQNIGMYLLLKGSVELQYNWSANFATSFSMSYQQGFKPFLFDTVNIIRPYLYSSPNEHRYFTNVNGTSLQWHFSFKYIFGYNFSYR